MSGENGIGGRGKSGSALLSDLIDPHRARGAANLLAQALDKGYIDGFTINYADLKAKAQTLVDSDNPRLRNAGIKLQLAMAFHDLKLVGLAQESMGDKVPVQHEHRHFVVPPPRVLGESNGS